MPGLLDWLISLILGRPVPPVPPTPPPVPPVVPTPPMDQRSAGAAVLRASNTQRARYGLPPLTYNERLAAAALVQARDCARRDLLTHTGSDGSSVADRAERAGYRWSGIAENAAQQPLPPPGWPGSDPRTPEWAVSGWMASPGHRANLLGRYQDAGVAFADAASGTRYWISVYGNPAG